MSNVAPQWPPLEQGKSMPEPSVITVVSGLPRSGTSLMMQMLGAGGCSILSDGLRPADANNPQGYFEYELVKRLPVESGWLHLARGKAVKIVAPLLSYLPMTASDGSPLHYRVVFMNRDWEDVADSQSRMLRNLGLEHLLQPEPLVRRGMLQDRAVARAWLALQSIPGIDVDYQQTVNAPAMTAAKLAALIPAFQQHAATAVVIPKI